MLKKINEASVESNEGFSIKPTGAEGMEYKNNDKIALLEVIYSPSTKKIKINVTKTLFWTVPSGEVITDAERKLMHENIFRAVKLLKDDFEIV